MQAKKILFLLPITVLLLLSAVIVRPAPDTAWAIERKKEMTVVQTGVAYYSGTDYLDGNKFFDTDSRTDGVQNELLSSLTFYADGEPFLPDTSSLRVSGVYNDSVLNPGLYEMTFDFTYEGTDYTVSSVSVTLKKRIVTITVLLNGSDNITVEEGANVFVSYDYSGAVPSHVEQTETGGVSVTVLKSEYLDSPAYVDKVPTEPIENDLVVASHAGSPYYDFRYVGAYITVYRKVQNTLLAGDTDDGLMLTGSFSALYSVEYENIGTGKTSADYVAIEEKARSVYESTGLFDNYKEIGCYSVTVLSNNNPIYVSVPSQMTIMDKNVKSGDSYKIIALYNNGTTEIVDATLVNGYLTCSVKDFGDFILLQPGNGLGDMVYFIIIGAAVLICLFVILLFSVFRRKY